MGLKEKAQSFEGKKLMTSFFIAEALDSVMTSIDINYFGGGELNPGSQLMRGLEQNETIALKTAIVAAIICTYALASIHEPKFKVGYSEIKPKYVMERALQSANVFAWGIVLLNSLTFAPDVVAKALNVS